MNIAVDAQAVLAALKLQASEATAVIRNLPTDPHDDYIEVRLDERERVITALATQALPGNAEAGA